MVTYIENGDVFKVEGVFNYAHGCNCSGVMGKGIAVQFKDKFPEMFKQYKELCKRGEFNLGDLFQFNYGSGYIFNLGTQLSWKTKADINAIDKALKKMMDFSSMGKILKIALPKIGAGLGGLEWDTVKCVIDKNAKLYPEISLYVIENYKP